MEKIWIIFICQMAAITFFLMTSFLTQRERTDQLQFLAFATAIWTAGTVVAASMAITIVFAIVSQGLTTFDGNLPLKPFLFISATVLHFICMKWLPLKDGELDLSQYGKIVSVEVVAFVLMVGSMIP